MCADEVAKDIVDAALKVHRALGPGLLESAYQACLAHDLERSRHCVECEVGAETIRKNWEWNKDKAADPVASSFLGVLGVLGVSFFRGGGGETFIKLALMKGVARLGVQPFQAEEIPWLLFDLKQRKKEYR
jgi:hypothetical protein